MKNVEHTIQIIFGLLSSITANCFLNIQNFSNAFREYALPLQHTRNRVLEDYIRDVGCLHRFEWVIDFVTLEMIVFASLNE